jgi:hypothetical protein
MVAFTSGDPVTSVQAVMLSEALMTASAENSPYVPWSVSVTRST